MNAEVKTQWVEALRSGQYKQGQEQLHKASPEGDRFCCLGVLCDLAKKAGVTNVVKIDQNTAYDEELEEDVLVNSYDVWYGDDNAAGLVTTTSFEVLPENVRVWAGLEDGDPLVFNDKGEAVCISGLNDSGAEFPTLAEVIEEQL